VATCKEFDQELFVSDAIFELRYEINQFYLKNTVFLNETLLQLTNTTSVGKNNKSTPPLYCFDASEQLPQLKPCIEQQPATLVCYTKRLTECSPSLIYQIISESFDDEASQQEYGAYAVSFTPRKFDVDSEVTFYCDSGYNPVDESLMNLTKIKCQSNGLWSGFPLPLKCKSKYII
jgi:hypothetical protein